MLQKMKELGVLFSLCFVCVFSGCEKDTFEETFEKKGNPLTIKKLPFESLKNNPALLHKLEQLNAKKAAFFGKTVTDPVHNFSFDTEDVTYIENGSQHSYTFPIVRTVPGLYVENLVLNREEDGVYHAYITTYKLSREQVLRLETVGSLNDKMTIRALPDFDMAVLGKGKLKPCHTLITVPVAWNEQGQVTHSELIELIDKDCIDQLNSGGQTSTGDGNSGNGGASDGGWGGWMGTGYDTGVYDPPGANNGNDTGAEGNVGHVGGGGAVYGDGSPVITTPVVPMTFTSFIKNFKQGVSQLVPDNQWWNTTNGKKIVQYLQHNFNTQTGSVDFQVSEFVISCLNYLAINEFTNESQSFIIDCIESVKNNGVVDLDNNIIYLIDKPCQNEVLKNIISTSSPFTNLIRQTFNTSDKVNLKISNGDLPNAAAAYTNPFFYGDSNNFTINIRLDNQYLNNATDLSIVAVTLHELVHAYLMNLYLKGNLVAENSSYNNLMNAFLNFYKDRNDITFNELDSQIHNAMSDFIQKMGNSIYNYAQLKNVQGVTVDYCIGLAWSTMNGYELFEEILTSTKQIEYAQIGYNEENNTGNKKGKTCP